MSAQQPTGREIPQLVVDRALAPALSSRLVAMVIHVVGGRASAEVHLTGPSDPSVTRVEVGTTRLAIRLPSGDKLFTGRIAEVETRMGEDASTTVVLFARGSAPTRDSDRVMPLRIGADLVSGSVRRGTEGASARGVTTVQLRYGSRIRLLSDEAEFEGLFQVTELWSRFDAQRGLRVEFVATR